MPNWPRFVNAASYDADDTRRLLTTVETKRRTRAAGLNAADSITAGVESNTPDETPVSAPKTT